MKKFIKLTALLLCVAMLTSTLAGCGMFYDDTPEDVFDPPYLENYYVNKHDPVVVSGNIEVYKYDKDAEALWMGGYPYHGGFEFRGSTFGENKAVVDLPLDGQYENISFVIGGKCGKITEQTDKDGNVTYPYDASQYNCSPPTLYGYAKEEKVGLQFWVDDKMVEEVIFSNYQVPVRYTFNVSGAQKFTFKQVAAEPIVIPVLELTVWEGEAHETGHITSPAGSEPVQLIKDLKPYQIPATSSAVYYPNITPSSEGRNYIEMSGVRYENVIATYISQGLMTDDEEDIYFNLEGKYNYLTFTAGVADRTSNNSDGSAWLTVFADGKIVHEEVYSSHELPRTTTVNIEGCHQLKFAWLTDEGNLEYGDSTGNFFGIADAYVATTKEALDNITGSSQNFPDRPVKMVSELGAFGISSSVEQAVFDGSSSLATFSMGGVKYNEGIILIASNSMLETRPACVSFNLGGKYDTISFVAGHIANSDVYKNDQIEIYADGVLIKTIDVDCTMLPEEYVVDVTGCQHLEFVSGKATNGSWYRPALGIVNIVAYPDGYVETDLFPERSPADYGESCDLIETFGFYDVHSGGRTETDIGGVDVEDGYYDGSTQKNYFTIGDRKINSGVLLRTSVHLSLDTDMIHDAIFFTGLVVLAGEEAHESAFALANIKDSGYTSVTFTVAMQKDTGYEDETTLKIGADDKCVKEITLSKDMKPTTYTVELGEDCGRLLFFLECTIEDDASHTYAIYDIKLNK